MVFRAQICRSFSIFLFGFMLCAAVVLPQNSLASTAEEDRKIALEVLTRRAEDFARLQDWQNSAAVYTKALKRDPGNADILFGLGYAHYRLGHYEDAVRAFRQAAHARPDHADATLWLGMTFLATGTPGAAMEPFSHLLESERVDPRAWYGLAAAHDALHVAGGSSEHKELAEKHYEQYMHEARRAQGAGTEFQQKAGSRLIELRYGKEGRLYTAAVDAHRRGDYEESLRLLNRALALNPTFQKAHYLKGVSLSTKPGEHLTSTPRSRNPSWNSPVPRMRRTPAVSSVPSTSCSARSMPPVRICRPPSVLTLTPRRRSTCLAHSPLRAVSRTRPRTSTAGRSRSTPRQRKVAQRDSNWDLIQGRVGGPVIFARNPEEQKHRIESQGIVDDAYLTARLNTIMERLVRENHLPYLWEKYSLAIIRDESVQAFSLPGGNIYVNIGLIRHVKEHHNDSDDVLAFVIAHEIAHVEQDHVIDTVRHVEALGRTVEGLPRARTILTEFQKSDEFEADCLGTRYAYLAGFDPLAGEAFLESMVTRGQFPGPNRGIRPGGTSLEASALCRRTPHLLR